MIFANGWFVCSASCFCLDVWGAKVIDDDWKEELEFATEILTPEIGLLST